MSLTNISAFVSGVRDKIEAARAANKLRAMDKKDVRDLIATNISFHESVVSILSAGDVATKAKPNATVNQIWNKLREEVTPKLAKSNTVAKDVLKVYQKQLRAKAAQAEAKSFLLSLLQANQFLIEIMQEIDKKFDTVVDTESITLYNVRFSYIATLGIIKQSELVGNFTAYLITYLINVNRGTENNIPKYRLVYLMSHVNEVAEIVSELLGRNGKYSFVDDIVQLRKRFQDIEFNSATNIRGFDGSLLSIPGTLLNWIYNLIPLIGSLFTGLIDDFDEWKLNKYEEKKEMKEWMQQHVAMLRMDLDGVDKTSPEYIRLTKVIEAYDAKITEYDKEILKFEEENG